MSVINLVKENEDLSIMLKNEVESVMQKLEGSGGLNGAVPCGPNNTILESSATTRENLKTALNYIHTINDILYGNGSPKLPTISPPKDAYRR